MIRLTCAVASLVAAAAVLSVGVPAASGADLPVAVSATATDYSVSFADDPALSFTFPLDGFLPGALTTGGGWIFSVDGSHASFGFVAGVTSTASSTGHLVYDDKGAGLRLIGTITNYSPVGCSAIFIGLGEINGVPGQEFNVAVTDGGEPGTSDAFTIITGIYANSGSLLGGDIQQHDPTCP